MENLINKHNLNVGLFRYDNSCDFKELKGHYVVDIYHDKEVFQVLTKTHLFVLRHEQDCCESVELIDVVGDVKDLIGREILLAEESSKSGDMDYGTETWTYYKLGTIKGYVDLRWHGDSNGYYSESVDCLKVEVA